MNYLDFEKPVEELTAQLEKTREIAGKGKVDMTKTIAALEEQLLQTKKNIYGNLTPWQRVQLSRHPDRPYSLEYIQSITDNTFIEFFGDRNIGDDKAVVGGMGIVNGQTIMFIGQQKGNTTKQRQYRNFGMMNPEGYRKALRLMKLAEKFNKPVVTLIDTPGAYPGLEAEERGQGEAIARNIYEMSQLQVPVICVIIGEGASGGALGIGIGDRVLMLENTWYSVISPESCSSILWRSWDFKEKAADALKLTATDMFSLNLVDGIIPEPLGGAHWDYNEAGAILKKFLIPVIKELKAIPSAQRSEERIKKFERMGFWDELPETQEQIS